MGRHLDVSAAAGIHAHGAGDHYLDWSEDPIGGLPDTSLPILRSTDEPSIPPRCTASFAGLFIDEERRETTRARELRRDAPSPRAHHRRRGKHAGRRRHREHRRRPGDPGLFDSTQGVYAGGVSEGTFILLAIWRDRLIAQAALPGMVALGSVSAVTTFAWQTWSPREKRESPSGHRERCRCWVAGEVAGSLAPVGQGDIGGVLARRR